MKSPDPKPATKPYHRPRLLVYGDLNAVTQAVGSKAMPDNSVTMLMIKS
jgi:hypothetical protein